jgi:hypothetical protein
MPYGDSLPDRIVKLLKVIPRVEPRSDSLLQQLDDLRWVAMRLGMMDAANEIYTKYLELDYPPHKHQHGPQTVKESFAAKGIDYEPTRDF